MKVPHDHFAKMRALSLPTSSGTEMAGSSEGTDTTGREATDPDSGTRGAGVTATSDTESRLIPSKDDHPSTVTVPTLSGPSMVITDRTH